MIKRQHVPYGAILIMFIIGSGCTGQLSEGRHVKLMDLIDYPEKYYMPDDIPVRYKEDFYLKTEGFLLPIEKTNEVIGYDRAWICELHVQNNFYGFYLLSIVAIDENHDPYLPTRLWGTLQPLDDPFSNSTAPIFYATKYKGFTSPFFNETTTGDVI